MKREELIKCFDNEKTTKDTDLDVFETNKLLEIEVIMKHNHQIIIGYNEREEYIDISSNHYIGLGGTLVSPIEDIEKIIVKWR